MAAKTISEDPRTFEAFIGRFRVMQLSRRIAWRTAMLQSCLPQGLGENDAGIAATALAYDATLAARDAPFTRVPRLRYLEF